MSRLISSELLGYPSLLVSEIQESKWLIVELAVHVRFSFGSFQSFWSALVRNPPAPFLPQSTHDLVVSSATLGVPSIAIIFMWRAFRRRQASLPSPWKEVDSTYFVQLLHKWSGLRGLHYLATRLASQRQSVRRSPSHFRHTLTLLYSGSVLYAAVKTGGLQGLFDTIRQAFIFDFAFVAIGQVLASFGLQENSKLVPPLAYRHKPPFAWGAISQACALGLVVLNHSRVPRFLLMASSCLLPISSSALSLLNILDGPRVHSLNEPTPVDSNSGAPTSPFCEVCQRTIFSHSDTDPDSRDKPHHHTTASLQRSAESQCRICSTLWERRSSIPWDLVSDCMYWRPTTQYRWLGNDVTIRFKHDIQRKHDCGFQLHKEQKPDFYGVPGERRAAQGQLLLPELPRNTGSDESLNLVAKWLQNCRIFHGVCSSKRHATFRPSRLLFLDNNQISICTMEEMPRRVSYLTLSHCWGRVHLIRLLQGNEVAFRNGIAWEALPKTFQDAIKITRRLKISYLWIDSLCIIQDSVEDWDKEAKLMGKIYQNALCNIAASDSPDSSHGCFHSRNPRTLQPVMVEEGQYLVNNSEDYDDHVLYTRAWVLQEALLARRTLDCGRDQLFWRCGEMRASEVFPAGVPAGVKQENHPASKFKFRSSEGEELILNADILEAQLRSQDGNSEISAAIEKRFMILGPDTSVFGLWAAIVGSYTSMNLTKDTDRAVALTGITDIFRPLLGEHFHGLWTIFLPIELLWVPEEINTLPTVRSSPTWSWMSLEGHKSYRYCKFRYGQDLMVTKFLKVEIKEENETQLRLQTPLLRAKWAPRGEQTPWQPVNICNIQGEEEVFKWMGMHIAAKSYGVIFFDHWSDVMPPKDIFCMVVRISNSRETMNSVEMGLVLQEVRDGVFERVGYFEASRETLVPFLKRAETREIIII